VPTYALYLESGPQRKTTLVHVLALLGCVQNGKTTDEAIAATPDAIRAYLRYLRRHGEKVVPDGPVETEVAEHITEGEFLGQGSPQAIYPADIAPLASRDLDRYLRWLAWSRADLLALVEGIDDRTLRAKPDRGRSLRDILLHVLGADKGYLYSFLGPVKSVGEPVNAAMRDALDLRLALERSRAAAIGRLTRLTAAERRSVRRVGQSTRTAHRTIRRMLEHEWEHRREIAARLGKEA
jgi:uncharacterized damage-inducible protein DinB/predicted RNase H-like HicB family nuclease